MALPLLAAALIVKDEERNLPGCLAALEQLRPLLDQVAVYDTGSSDGTVEVARATGARVERGFWDGDFSRARNRAIGLVRARWVLIVDADERPLADIDRLGEALRRGLARATERDALVVPLVNIAPDGAPMYAAGQIRVFRPERARYVGRLHERVEPLDPRHPLRLDEQPGEVLRIRHEGYRSAEVIRAKAERNLLLVDAELDAASAGNDPVALGRALYHRGRTLVSAGRVSEAVAELTRLRSVPGAGAERVWGGDVLAQLLLVLGRLDELDPLVAELRAEGVDGRYCDWLRARGLLGRERYEEALGLLRTIDALTDAAGRVLDLAPVVEAQMIAAGRVGAVDEATACCIRMMAGFGRAEGLGPLLVTLWGARPVPWLAQLLTGTNAGHTHLAAVAAELGRCPEPGPQLAAALGSMAAASGA